MLYYTEYTTQELGTLTLATDGLALCGCWFEGQRFFGYPYREAEKREDSTQPILHEACAWLDSYFAGEKPHPGKLILKPEGTIFQRRVWRMLQEIWYGNVTTYGQLAFKLALQTDKPSMSAQAVGSAVGHNPISIIIPCHRVIGADGSLTGYAGGIERKQWLLNFEGADLKHIDFELAS